MLRGSGLTDDLAECSGRVGVDRVGRKNGFGTRIAGLGRDYGT